MIYNGRASKRHMMSRFGPVKLGIKDEWTILARGDRSPTIPTFSPAFPSSIAVCAMNIRLPRRNARRRRVPRLRREALRRRRLSERPLRPPPRRRRRNRRARFRPRPFRLRPVRRRRAARENSVR